MCEEYVAWCYTEKKKSELCNCLYIVKCLWLLVFVHHLDKNKNLMWKKKWGNCNDGKILPFFAGFVICLLGILYEHIFLHIFCLCASLGILAISCRGPLVPYASVFLHCVMWSLLTVTCTWKDSGLLGEKKPCFKRAHVSWSSVVWRWLDLTSVVATHRNGCLCFSKGEVKRMQFPVEEGNMKYYLITG